MIRSFFTALSYIFHPIFLPTLGLYFLFSLPATSAGLIDTSLFGIDHEIKSRIYQIFITLLIVAPGISIAVMVWSGMIESVKMKYKKDRIYALSIMVVYTLFCYVYLRIVIDSPSFNYLLIYLFSILLTTSIGFIINLFIKISLHAIGFFGLIGALVGYLNNQHISNIYFLLFLIILGGLICSSRIYLKAHNPKEVLLGMLVGFGIEFLALKSEWFL